MLRGWVCSLRSGLAGGLLAAVLLAGGCGGSDDDGQEADDTGADAPAAENDSEGGAGGDAEGGAGGDEAAPADDELALGDPCELVAVTTVAGMLGEDVMADLTNVGDGLPGATCAYTAASGGTIALSVTPGGAGFFEGYKDQALAAGGVEELSGVGDEAFVFQDVEVAARTGDAMIQLQVLTSATTAATGGVEIVRAAVDAIAG